MEANSFLAIVSLLYILVISVKFFLSKKISNKETKIYQYMLCALLFQIVVGLLLTLSMWKEAEIFSDIFNKLYLISMILWIMLFTIYIAIISIKNEKIYKKIKLILIALSILSIILSIVLPSELIKNADDSLMYSTGMAVNIVYMFSLICFITIFTSVLSNIKSIKDKRYIPLAAFTIVGLICMIIQSINPELFLVTPLECYIIFIMYFTIENPDVKMLEQVSMAKDAAEKANHAKTDFLSNMSHEIRTPLNAIVGFSESLKEDNIPDSSKEKVNDIIMASENLLDIVNGILDISKIEANKLEIINKEYDIKSMLDELVALTKARIGDKGLDFRVNIDESIPRVLYGDSVRLKQIYLNILTNAVKYTKEGYIDFTVSSVIKDNVCRLIVSVEDSGIGIKQENIDKLFSKFERLEVEKQFTIEGTGLGLAITKKLVELMRGKIVVQSVYGKGSKFTVSIDQRIIAVEPVKVKETNNYDSKVIDANGSRILIVDDNELNIKVAATLLKKYNFDIDSCTSGGLCLEKISKGEKYDIIFLDDMMPKMSGRETLERLKQNDKFDVPVIALTANAITGMKEEYLECGFDDYLSKPIEKNELERVIRTYLNKNKQNASNGNISTNVTSSKIKDNIDVDTSLVNKNINKDKILVVGKDDIISKIKNNLDENKYDITEINSGVNAIEKVIDTTYDLIVLNEITEDLEALEVMENITSLENFKTPVILIISKNTKMEDGHNFAFIIRENKIDELLVKEVEKILNK